MLTDFTFFSQVVDLSANKLEALNENAFTGLISMTSLDLSDNRLLAANMQAVFSPGNLPVLVILKLNGNPFEFIGETQFAGYLEASGRTLDLPNDMPCDCRTSWAWIIEVNATVNVSDIIAELPVCGYQVRTAYELHPWNGLHPRWAWLSITTP